MRGDGEIRDAERMEDEVRRDRISRGLPAEPAFGDHGRPQVAPASPWTPGPLRASHAKRPDNVGGIDWAIADAEGKIVGEAFAIVGFTNGSDAVGGFDRRPALANARLWAAAPDLAAALEDLLDDLVMDKQGGPESAERARAALRKAKDDPA